MTRSLRTSLLLGTGLPTILVLAAAGAGIHLLVAKDLRTQFDEILLSKARLLASTVEQDMWTVELEFDDLEMGEFLSPRGPGFLQLWQSQDSTLYRSPSLGEMDLPFPPTTSEEPRFRYFDLPGGLHGRGVCLVFTPRWDRESFGRSTIGTREFRVTLILARSTELMDRMLARLGLYLTVLLLLALSILSASLVTAIGLSLKPVNRLAADIERLGEDDLTVRLESGRLPAEIHPVVDRMNDFLDRLTRAFAREKAFSADVAHELRTPLAGLQSLLEVSLARSRSADEYEATLKECLQISGHLQTLVRTLLSLARMEAGHIELDLQTVALDDVIRSAWRRFQDRAQARGLSIKWDLAAARPISTDPALLEAAVGNVLDNAVSHVNSGGALRICTREEAGTVILRVSNTGCAIDQTEAEELRDRFRRGDRARSETGMHHGLGLSVIREVMRVFGGEVRIRAERGGRYEITLTLPTPS